MINRIRDRFTRVDNFVLNDKNITLKAKGLYAFLCSKPDDWSFSYAWLKSQLKEWEKSLKAWVKELVDLKVLLRIPIISTKKDWTKYSNYEWVINPTEEDLSQNIDPLQKGADQNGGDQKGGYQNGGDQKGGDIDNNKNTNTKLSNTKNNNTNVLVENSFEFKMASNFYINHLENQSVTLLSKLNDWKTKNNIIQEFATHIEKIKRIDKISEEVIEKVLNFLYSHSKKNRGKSAFCWLQQIQTTKKLRDKNREGVKYFFVLAEQASLKTTNLDSNKRSWWVL